jgi:hypothetical protein
MPRIGLILRETGVEAKPFAVGFADQRDPRQAALTGLCSKTAPANRPVEEGPKWSA